MSRQGRSSTLPQAGHEVDSTRRETNLLRELDDATDRKAGILRRLQNGRIAYCEAGREAAAKHLRWVIPRDDMAGNAVRLVDDTRAIAVQIRQGLAMQFVSSAAKILAISR